MAVSYAAGLFVRYRMVRFVTTYNHHNKTTVFMSHPTTLCSTIHNTELCLRGAGPWCKLLLVWCNGAVPALWSMVWTTQGTLRTGSNLLTLPRECAEIIYSVRRKLMAVWSSCQTNIYNVSLWVIGIASRNSCSQHLVVVSENAGTALVWNSNGRCRSLGYGGSSLESVGFTAT